MSADDCVIQVFYYQHEIPAELSLLGSKKTKEVETLIEETKTLLTGDEEPEVDLVEHGDMAALVGVRKFPARIKCATLAWHALEAALKGENEASTE